MRESKPSAEPRADVAGERASNSPIGDPDVGETLEASLAAQVRLLWELELGDTPMALSFEPSSARA